MNLNLAVWHPERAVSLQEAADLYHKLRAQELQPTAQYPNVYAFYNELTSRFPEVENVAEEDLDNCPWACSLDRSGMHIIMGILESAPVAAEAVNVILDLAKKYRLACFDQYNQHLYLPSDLQN
jgi:hypothetical protein